MGCYSVDIVDILLGGGIVFILMLTRIILKWMLTRKDREIQRKRNELQTEYFYRETLKNNGDFYDRKN